MKRVVPHILVLFVLLVSILLLGGLARAQQDIPRMTKEDLKPLFENPDVVVIDVRAPVDWEKDSLMIKGAIREDPMNVASWMNNYSKDKGLVFYCA